MSLARYFQCRSKKSFFLGQHNPRRADRGKGAGRKQSPPGTQTQETIDTSCFLCTDNVRWQQQGIQLYYQFPVNERIYNALCNPFPFMPLHITIASMEHEPQSWHESSKYSSDDKIKRIVKDLYTVTTRLSNFIGFYNGVGSIKQHLHYQIFEIPSGHPNLFPLQYAAEQTMVRTGMSRDQQASPLRIQSYPLTAFKIWGNEENIIENILQLTKKWDDISGDSASANIIFVWEKLDGNPTVCSYFVPRNRFFSHAPGLSGAIGSLEVLGEFIFCEKWEDQMINEQKVNYDYMWRILRAVEPPKAKML